MTDDTLYKVFYRNAKPQTMLGCFLKSLFRDGYGQNVVSWEEIK